jgi:uncharacterized ferredoxin-like protein
MYSIRLVDENENILCQKMSEVIEEKDKNQLEMDLSNVKDGVIEWEK